MSLVLLKNPIYTNNLEILKESESESVYPRLLLKGKIQEAIAGNSNGRKYKTETLQQKIIDERCSESRLLTDPLFGESIHPDDSLTGEINPEKIIWRIAEAHMEGNSMIGTVEIIPETPIGKILYYLVEKYQAKPGISSRGFGAMDGDWVDHDSYRFVTFDGTFNPSTHGAFLNKIGESSEMKEMIKSFSKEELNVLQESSILRLDNGHSLVENMFKTKYHIINNKKDRKMSTELELLQESNLQVTNLTKQLSESNSALKDNQRQLAEATVKLKESEDEKEEIEKDFEESKKKMSVMEKDLEDAEDEKEVSEKKLKEMEDEDEEDEKEKEKLEENYNKSIEVLEGVVSEFHKIKGYYDKSIEVLNLVESRNSEGDIKNLVESELGDYSKFETLFESVTDLGKARVMVESLKKIQSGNGPTKIVSLHERNDGGSTAPLSDDEGRINAYDI